MAALSFTSVRYLFRDTPSETVQLSARKKDDTNTSLSFSSHTSLWYSKRLFLLDNKLKQLRLSQIQESFTLQ